MKKEEKEKHKNAKLDKNMRERDDNIVERILDDERELPKREIRKRNRTMRNVKVLFRAIDLMFCLSQNSCPYINKENVGLIDCKLDVVYDDKQSDTCKLDFYRDNSGDKQPAIILIHGGGFTAGDKKYRKGRAQFFALNGFSVFCVNYGLAPEHNFPDPLKHIVNAANFIYDHADEFNIDKDKIFVDGDSAGAYYASMLAAFNVAPQLEKNFGCAPKFKIFGALLNCGLYDMQTILNTKYPFDIGDGMILSLMGIHLNEFNDYEYKDVCEPIRYVERGFPPSFIVYSENDAFCKGQSELFVKKLKEKGVYCEYFSARKPKSNHCFSLTWSGEDASAANELTLSFAKRLSEDKIKL